MKPGTRVQLRSPAEILASLDQTGSLDGLPFMPELLGFFGRTMRVSANTERLCDTITPIAVRAIPEAVLLDDLRCDGAAHGGCQAQCRLYWKEAWLRPASAEEQAPAAADEAALAELERRVTAHATAEGSTDAQPLFRCQATELQRASEPVAWWDSRSLLGQVTTRNVGIVRFVRVMTRAVLGHIARKTGLLPRFTLAPQTPPNEAFEAPPPRGLAVGTRVRVRSREEIVRTLTPDGKNKGLWFDREMLRYCGTTARVQAKVERFIDEPTGRLVRLSSDCYILAGAVCSSDVSDGRWFCPREIYPWWRECWLEPVAEDG
jgi:hypothetical protein